MSVSCPGYPRGEGSKARALPWTRQGQALGTSLSVWEHAKLWGSLHYRCGRLVTVRGVEAGIPRAEGNLERAVLHGIVMNPTGLHALCPGVQHGEHGHGAADVTRIAREFDDRGGGSLHQHGIAVALMGAQHLAQFSRNGDGDVEVWHRQHLRLTAFEPFLCLGGVALGTTAVVTRMIGEHLRAARLAAPHLAAEGGGAAVE